MGKERGAKSNKRERANDWREKQGGKRAKRKESERAKGAQSFPPVNLIFLALIISGKRGVFYTAKASIFHANSVCCPISPSSPKNHPPQTPNNFRVFGDIFGSLKIYVKNKEAKIYTNTPHKTDIYFDPRKKSFFFLYFLSFLFFIINIIKEAYIANLYQEGNILTTYYKVSILTTCYKNAY